MIPYRVYILDCLDKKGNNSFYTGMTKTLLRRLSEHGSRRGARFTRGKSLTLVLVEDLSNFSKASRREREIKKMSRKEKQALIDNSPKPFHWFHEGAVYP